MAKKWNKDHVRLDWNLDNLFESNETLSQHAHEFFYLKFVFLFCSVYPFGVLADLRTWGGSGDRWIAQKNTWPTVVWLAEQRAEHFCDWLNRQLNVVILAWNQNRKNVIILNAVNSFVRVEVCQIPLQTLQDIDTQKKWDNKCAPSPSCAPADVQRMTWMSSRGGQNLLSG